MTDPRVAVALRYLAGTDHAPRVVARGRGDLADRILALAKEHGVPVRPDRDLVEALAALDVGAEIPPRLYEALAEVLAYVLKVNEKAAR
ncbi:MAG: EscU/YscU/HrcU family type III secretion system export apparatus switch protein [Planctomycetes bacterium]|nr:EscU/YscU/HrcU family type III secretion system export apparatus switch protein [Planctomycetota bacterium]